MKNTVALINLYSTPEFGLLTEKRPAASTTFLGRYTFIDFALSNLTNSGVDNVGIMIKNYSRSIIKHIRSDNAYLKNPKTGFFQWMIHEEGFHNPFLNTDINNLRANDYFLYDKDSKYVLFVPVGFVMKVDYRKVVEEHIKSNKKVSVLYSEVENAGKDYLGLNKITINALGNVQKVDKVDPKDKTVFISLRTYIFDKDYLKECLDLVKNISNVYNMADLMTYIQRYSNYEIHGIKFDGALTYVNSLEKYYEATMKLKDNLENLNEDYFSEDWKIYTRTHDTRPVLYGPNCDVVDSVVANGCSVYGKVKNSVLARNVVVEEGATVEDSIIFSDCVIKSGVHLKRVVSDKLCVFAYKNEVCGAKNEIIYVPQGEKI